jgi:hypothetical protein
MFRGPFSICHLFAQAAAIAGSSIADRTVHKYVRSMDILDLRLARVAATLRSDQSPQSGLASDAAAVLLRRPAPEHSLR